MEKNVETSGLAIDDLLKDDIGEVVPPPDAGLGKPKKDKKKRKSKYKNLKIQ